ncbi:MAG: TatD family hydrolase [Victivallales bacterium]|nr:TatD family hydrolase [Victivallales bacterium]
MVIIEPHIHMYSRTTDDYQRMYDAGIRACVEPSFWLGASRRYAGTFFDYFNLILDFETVRARRFGIDHFAAVSLNPKESEDHVLAKEVIDGIDEYLEHPRCVALGEIGFNNNSREEEYAFERQLHLANERKMPVIIHLPHFDKVKGIELTTGIIKNEGIPEHLVVIDHNTEDSMPLARKTGCYTGMTVYPISKLTPQRVSSLVKEFGSERMIINGSADWGISDPLSLVKVVDFMSRDGHSQNTLKSLLFDNPSSFYSASPKWKPEFDLVPVDPREFQR